GVEEVALHGTLPHLSWSVFKLPHALFTFRSLAGRNDCPVSDTCCTSDDIVRADNGGKECRLLPFQLRKSGRFLSSRHPPSLVKSTLCKKIPRRELIWGDGRWMEKYLRARYTFKAR